ncbi:MAG: 3D domain-containing protein [Syntrophomonas sp.]
MHNIWSRRSTFLIGGVVAIGLLLGSLFFALQKPVSIEVDGKVIKTRVFFANTVADALTKEHIKLAAQDKVEPAASSVLRKNTKIKVARAFKVKITADGTTKEIVTTPITIKEAIKIAGFKLGNKDIVKTLPTLKTVPNQEIEVIRVTEKEQTEQQEVPFQVERTSDPTLEKGLTRTVAGGKKGVALNTVKITYHNGQETKRELIKSQVLVQPQNRVTAMGTITSVSRGGQRLDFREVKSMEASAYTYTGYRTATGQQPRVGMIAVDPRVISFGTRVYVDGYGYAYAADTGGMIKGDRIDLFMEEYSQCVNWGRRNVNVYILK